MCASAFEKLRLDGVIDDEGARAKTKTQILAGRMQGMNFKGAYVGRQRFCFWLI